MATNNSGHLLDSSGNVAVDYVWGNFAPQPNDDRADGTPAATITVGGDQNVQWTLKSTVDSARLNPALGNHSDIETAWSGFPDFIANTAGEKLSGVYYISVPNVLGLTTALALDALKDAGYEAANITTATAATNAAGVVTAAARTAGSTTITLTDSSHGFVAGNKVTISGVDASVNGTYTVVSVADANTFTVTGTATTVLALSAITGAVVAVAGTIKSQSTAAGANSILTSATITVTPWAAAS
jgi:hypothetical protein